MKSKKWKMIGFIFLPNTFFYLALACSVELEIERQKSSFANRPEALPPDVFCDDQASDFFTEPW